MEDAYPLEGQCANGHLMRFLLLALQLIEGLGPEREPQRFIGLFNECLSEELGATEAPVHPGLVARGFRHRRDAGISAQRVTRREACPVFSKGD